MNVDLRKPQMEEETSEEQDKASEKEEQIMRIAEKCLKTARLYSFV